MNNLHITCNNLEQRQNVFNVLDAMGLGHSGDDGNFLKVYADNDIYWTVVKDNWNSTQLTYTQFMEQYLMQALRNTIKNSGLSNPELSLKLGHSRKYLTNLLNDGCSTELQNRLIEEINQVMAGTFKTDAEVISELTQRLVETQDYLKETTIKAGEVAELNINLTTENQTHRKNAQNHDIELKRIKDDLDYIKEENDQLRATAINQNELNKSLNTECAELAEKLGFKTKECLELSNSVVRKDKQLSERNDKINKLRQQQKIHRLLSLVCLATIILLIVTQWGV